MKTYFIQPEFEILELLEMDVLTESPVNPEEGGEDPFGNE